MTPYHCLALIYYYYYSCYTFMKGSAKTFGCEKKFLFHSNLASSW